MAERIPGLAVFWLSVRRSCGTVHGAPQRFPFGAEASALGGHKLHIEQGIGVALLVKVGALVGPEAHVLVKADGLRVLLVDGDFLHAVVLDAVLEQLLAQPLSAFRSGVRSWGS